MDRLRSLQVFREVVEAGSFAAAAARLSISAPMASKHLAQLERELGSRLLNRSSRHLSLTEAGQTYYAQCRDALDALQAAEAAVRQSAGTPRGELKVSAPVWCANPRFTQALVAYRRRYPQVLLDVRLENRQVDLVADGYDVALRATREPSASLIARPMAKVRLHLVASPAYLDESGRPSEPADLARHGAIMPSYVDISELRMQGPTGHVVKVRLNPVMRSDNSTLIYHAVHAGMGVGLLPDLQIGADLDAGRLERVLPDHEGLSVTLFAVYVSRSYMTPKLRSFIDFFAEALAPAELNRMPAGQPARADTSSGSAVL